MKHTTKYKTNNYTIIITIYKINVEHDSIFDQFEYLGYDNSKANNL